MRFATQAVVEDPVGSSFFIACDPLPPIISTTPYITLTAYLFICTGGSFSRMEDVRISLNSTGVQLEVSIIEYLVLLKDYSVIHS